MSQLDYWLVLLHKFIKIQFVNNDNSEKLNTIESESTSTRTSMRTATVTDKLFIIREAQIQFSNSFNLLTAKATTMDRLLANYIHDIWFLEFPPLIVDNSKSNSEQYNFNEITTTMNVVELLVADKELESKHLLSTISMIKESERIILKLSNLLNAIRYLFDFTSSNNHNENKLLSMELIKKIHFLSMNKLMGSDHHNHNHNDEAGEFRIRTVGSTGSNVRYTMPYNIERELEYLIKFVNKKLENIDRDESDPLKIIEKTILLIGLFHSEFLLIHPFGNGNGRCARLLVDFLLKNILIIPYTYFQYDQRNEYLISLDSINNPMIPPNQFAFYLLDRIVNSCKTKQKILFSSSIVHNNNDSSNEENNSVQ